VAANGCNPLPKKALPAPLVDGGAFPDHWRLVGLTSGRVSRVELRFPSGHTIATGTEFVPRALNTHLRFYVLEFRLNRKPGPGTRGALTLLAYDRYGKIVGHALV
jgi:hypothetical protein